MHACIHSYIHTHTLHYITLYYITLHAYVYVCMNMHIIYNLKFIIAVWCSAVKRTFYAHCHMTSFLPPRVVRFEWQDDARDNNLSLFRRLDARSKQKCIHCVFNIYVMT